MAFELEPIIGYLYVVGGRTITKTPPGMLVQVTPENAVRGRETDIFFAAVLPAGEMGPTSFYEQMATLASELYFEAGGSTTAALRAVLTNLNQNLFDHNRRGLQRYEANIVCGVLRGTEMYLARVGSAVAVLQNNGESLSFPDNLHDADAVLLPALGVYESPTIKMTRYDVMSGTRFVLGESHLAEIPSDRLMAAIVGANMEAVVESFKNLVSVRAQLMFVEFVPADQKADVPVIAGTSTTKIESDISKARIRARERAENEPDPEQMTRRQERTEAVQLRLQKGGGQIAQWIGSGVGAIGKFLGTPVPEGWEERQQQISQRYVTMAVVAIPVVVVLIVLLTWVRDVGGTEFEQCLDRATAAQDLARNIDATNRESVLAAWQGMLEIVDTCDELVADDPTVLALRTEAQTAVDRLSNVARREAIPLAAFPGARLSELVLQGFDLYALDKDNSQVYRLQIGDDGRSAANAGEPIPSLRRGSTVENFTIGNIVDIAYDDREDAIAILDDRGVLVRCPPRFIMQCESEQLLGVENWQNPRSMTIWQGRVYVMDSGLGQLLRYEPSGSSYISPPTEYFTGQGRPDLVNVVDFDIAEDGRVYVIYNYGIMQSYFGGEARSFGFSGFTDDLDLQNTTVQSFYMNDSPISPAFYIVSQASRTLTKTTLAGTFIATYRIFDDDKFELVTDIVVDPAQQIMYVASGNTVFAVPEGE